jgi:hypothetical protein
MARVRAREFWRIVVDDRVDLLDRLIAVLGDRGVRYCLVGGQAVNAYVEPVVSLDLDIVVAADQLEEVEHLLRAAFRVEPFPHRLNVSLPGADLRVQIQTDPRYSTFVPRAHVREVLGLRLPVARVEDVLQGKIWAVVDPQRRPSKRQKDLADIARVLEACPELRTLVPAEVLPRLL